MKVCLSREVKTFRRLYRVRRGSELALESQMVGTYFGFLENLHRYGKEKLLLDFQISWTRGSSQPKSKRRRQTESVSRFFFPPERRRLKCYKSASDAYAETTLPLVLFFFACNMIHPDVCIS